MLEKKKIYIATPFESRLAKRGTRLPTIADMLKAQDMDVEYITSNFSHAQKRYYTSDEIMEVRRAYPYKLNIINVRGYKKHISIERTVTHLFLAIKYFFYLLMRARKSDIIIIPSRPPELIFAGSIIRRIKGTKVVLDITDIWPDMLKTKNRLKKMAFVLYCNFFLYLSIPAIDVFIHSAPSFAEWINRYASGRISTFIPLGFDSVRWHDVRKGRWLDPPKNHNGMIHLVYVGVLSHQIELTPLIAAVSRCRNFHLTIIGDGEDLPKLRHMAQEKGAHNITFAGYLPYEAVVRELETKHIGVNPQIASSIANKVFDYIAATLPILVLGDNDASKFVVQNKIGWQQDFDVEGLKAFLSKLSMKEITEKSRNIARIRERYSKEYLYPQYIKLITGG